MFGWHVHEKAILLVLVPLRCTLSSTTYVRELNTNILISFSLLAAENNAYFRTFVIASVSGIFSLFPLLFTPAGLYRLFLPSVHSLTTCLPFRNLGQSCLLCVMGHPSI